MDEQEELLQKVYDSACELLSTHASEQDFSQLFEMSKAKLTRPTLLKELENYEKAFYELADFKH